MEAREQFSACTRKASARFGEAETRRRHTERCPRDSVAIAPTISVSRSH